MHDELGAPLTAAKLDVARLKSRIDMQVPEHAERIQHLTETLNNGIALKRRIIENLRPSSLSNLGLTASLEILTRDFAQSSNVQVEISLEEAHLSDTAQLTVYRLVQESLTNIGKYANARKVLVCVHNHTNHVSVQVRDDGAGFDTTRIRADAHGLLGMRHRVEAAGGSLTVSSTPARAPWSAPCCPTGSPEPVRRRPTPAHARHLPRAATPTEFRYAPGACIKPRGAMRPCTKSCSCCTTQWYFWSSPWWPQSSASAASPQAPWASPRSCSSSS